MRIIRNLNWVLINQLNIIEDPSPPSRKISRDVLLVQRPDALWRLSVSRSGGCRSVSSVKSVCNQHFLPSCHPYPRDVPSKLFLHALQHSFNSFLCRQCFHPHQEAATTAASQLLAWHSDVDNTPLASSALRASASAFSRWKKRLLTSGTPPPLSPLLALHHSDQEKQIFLH